MTGWAPLGLVPFFDEARKLPAEDALGLRDLAKSQSATRGRKTAHRRAAVCRAFRISTISIRCEMNRGVVVELIERAGQSRAMPISFCFRARRRRSTISPRCAPKAGTSTSRRTCVAADACSAFAADIRCSASVFPIRTASKGAPRSGRRTRSSRHRNGIRNGKDVWRASKAHSRDPAPRSRATRCTSAKRRGRTLRGRC